MLNLIDEFTRDCLAIRPRRRLNSRNVIEVLADAMIERGIPEHIPSDNGPEFVAQDLRKWLAATEPRRCTSNPAHPGRTAIARASTRN
jgi:putative transposase